MVQPQGGDLASSSAKQGYEEGAFCADSRGVKCLQELVKPVPQVLLRVANLAVKTRVSRDFFSRNQKHFIAFARGGAHIGRRPKTHFEDTWGPGLGFNARSAKTRRRQQTHARQRQRRHVGV